MKKLFPLTAALLLLASCTAPTSSSQAPTSSSTPASSSEAPSSSAASVQLDFLQAGEIYIDLNFANGAPEGFAIKMGNAVITETGKYQLSATNTVTIEGEFDKKLNFYSAIETASGSTSGSIGQGIDPEGYADYCKKKMDNFNSKFNEGRVYACFSDQDRGWSKTLHNVDKIITSLQGS